MVMDGGGDGQDNPESINELILKNDSCCCSYVIGLVLSMLGTIMLIIGTLASFAGASPDTLRSYLFPLTYLLSRLKRSSLCSRDRHFAHRHGFFDRGT
jgi:hypothetical protein